MEKCLGIKKVNHCLVASVYKYVCGTTVIFME